MILSFSHGLLYYPDTLMLKLVSDKALSAQFMAFFFFTFFCMIFFVQDDLSFKLEYVHPYLDGVYDPRNRTFRTSCFNSRKLSPVFTGGPGVDEVPAIWVDRVGFKANITEVCLSFPFRHFFLSLFPSFFFFIL